ncbi:MAG: TIGR03905 family TSCPD domain-containing protein [Defluviitaleaceae bacterium]|nr:TIGR03905 family TSCPD domain-containing protein [Defluviitaleaceae bacterium]
MVYKTKGVCSQEIHLEIADGVITELSFLNGCNGSLKGIAQLAKGRKADEIIGILGGIKCNNRPTSCPDQLAIALRQQL